MHHLHISFQIHTLFLKYICYFATVPWMIEHNICTTRFESHCEWVFHNMTFWLRKKKRNLHMLSAPLVKPRGQTLRLALLPSISPIIHPLPRYQMVRLTPAQMDRLSPCALCTSAQCRRVLGISSSGSGSDRGPSLGLATTMGSGPRCDWNSTTWSRFLSASVWWVSCGVEDTKRRGR